MPLITDTPPDLILQELQVLATELDNIIPAQAPNNILIGTWNLHSFGSVTRKWTATQKDSPKRDLRGLLAIGNIISRFDVVAIQEVKGNLRALRDLLKYLGDNWSFLMTDVTLGDPGNDERMAFLFHRRRIRASGLACELVVPPEWLNPATSPVTLREQFARTPYAVSFRAGNVTFILVTVHIRYGDTSSERIGEIQAIAQWMADWAKRSTRWHHNLILLGDFNIDRQGDDLWKAFHSTGLRIPDDLSGLPRSIFTKPEQPLEKYYDQIAWFVNKSNVPQIDMEYVSGGNFDFVPYVYGNDDLSLTSKSWRVSDHLPLWVQFRRK